MDSYNLPNVSTIHFHVIRNKKHPTTNKINCNQSHGLKIYMYKHACTFTISGGILSNFTLNLNLSKMNKNATFIFLNKIINKNN